MPKPHDKPSEPRSFRRDDPKYETDTFSRNDRAGAPSQEALEEAIDRQAELDAEVDREAGGGRSSVEATPDAAPRKATDDADSRDAAPKPPATGGVT